MNREILFRGKRTDNREWAYGYYTKSYSVAYIEYELDDCVAGAVVDPATVGQFTGLTDKNGVKIFEGDKLLAPNGKVAVCYFGTYEPWSRNGSDDFECWLLKVDGISVGLVKHTAEHMEVIGNIHDQKEGRP